MATAHADDRTTVANAPPLSAAPEHGVAPDRGGPWAALFAPVDIASLVVFRMAFGAIVVWEVYRYVVNGWIDRYWVQPPVRFSYYGFEWLPTLDAAGLRAVFAVLAVCGAGIALGACYRVAAAGFTLAFSYLFLLEAAHYLNHFYLMCLLGLLLTAVPAHRRLAVDAWARPGLRSDTVPAWSLWLVRAQIGVVYFYGGVAKLNSDWLAGEPLRGWLASYADLPLLGRFVAEHWFVIGASYGAMLFDLLVVPAVLWRRTRAAAVVLAAGFNVINNELFSLGVFPYLAFAGILLLCDPSWPRQLLAGLRGRVAALPRPRSDGAPGPRARHVIAALLGLYLAVQLVVPLRHYLYPGPPNWTEEGHQFAWHMKLRSKSGDATFVVRDPERGRRWRIDPADVLPGWQYDKMAIRPELLRQFAWYLADDFRARGRPGVEVRARVVASLNGRPAQRLIDPRVDLAAEPRRLGPQPWILPLRERLP